MSQSNLVGKKICGYSIVENLGSGSFGTVYKLVKQNTAGTEIRALKHITIPNEKEYNEKLKSMGGDVSKVDNYFSEMVNEIVEEIKIQKRLSDKDSRYIVRYYDNYIQDTYAPRKCDIYIIMEYLAPIEDYISQNKFLVHDVTKIGLDILTGLKICHDNNIIHRDIKDDNIFVSETGNYKIGDFGVSKSMKNTSRALSLKGTPNYLAPEVYSGKEAYTKSVDLYSLGIVLYRLLNYTRNPFLPQFPNSYTSQDEDEAFAKRMTGNILPDLPLLGGDKIGQVILKAISNSQERFKTADEFIVALENAIQETPEEVLNTKINDNNSSSIICDNAFSIAKNNKDYGATKGETNNRQFIDNNSIENKSKTLNTRLFETASNNYNGHADKKGKSVPQVSKTYAKTKFSTGKSKKLETEAIDKKIISKFAFVIPVILLIIGIVAYYIIIHNRYDKAVSLIDWLFSGSDNIKATLRDSNIVLGQVQSIIVVKIFWWCWLVALSASLFYVGKLLQAKSEPDAIGAIYTKKEAYFRVKDISDVLKEIKYRTGRKEYDSLISAVKKLEDKLSFESDFGYGNNMVLDCENIIAQEIEELVESASCLENNDFEKVITDMNQSILKINSLLRRRMELKIK